MPLTHQGWAYVSCSSGGSGAGSAKGPTGSIQFFSGSSQITGTANLLYLTASSNLVLTGNIYVNGNIIAKDFDVINHTISFLSSSGDSKFGDTNDDLHQFTGSIGVSRVASSPNIFTITASATPKVGINTDTPHASFTLSGSYAIQYKSTTVNYSIVETDYFIVVRTAAATEITLPAASTAGRGRMIIVKAAAVAPGVTVSASFGEAIDGVQFQQLLSDYASETYVCDGVSSWYIV